MRNFVARCGRRGLWLVAGACIGGVLVGGVAYATAPGTGGVINGCFNNANGQLRVLVNGTCKNNETSLDWNQTGPEGRAGATGSAGTAMAYEGDTATATILPATPPSAGEVSVAHVDNVPAGNYAFSATLRLTNEDPSVAPDVACYMIASDAIGRISLGQAKAQLGNTPGRVQQTTLAMQFAGSLRATTSLSIECGESRQGTITVNDASIQAVQVTDFSRSGN